MFSCTCFMDLTAKSPGGPEGCSTQQFQGPQAEFLDSQVIGCCNHLHTGHVAQLHVVYLKLT